MRTSLSCHPCFPRQGLEAARLLGADEAAQKAVLDMVMRLLGPGDSPGPGGPAGPGGPGGKHRASPGRGADKVDELDALIEELERRIGEQERAGCVDG
jgi:hypothetical protein